MADFSGMGKVMNDTPVCVRYEIRERNEGLVGRKAKKERT